MGNCSSEHHQQARRLFRTENLTNDPSAFRVFVKKRNKFIPGWLKINDDEIVFGRGAGNFQFWPLAHLRRYGYTCSGVFFFESGRRCATGEGLHTFQSHQAERIFHMVQSKIKIEEYARVSRAPSVASNHRVNSLVPNPGASSRIHPVQRFSSEGANNEFSPADHQQQCAPPPYSAFQETRRAHQNPSPNCPSVISTTSAPFGHYARTGPISNIGAALASLSRDRPRSVVSNIERGVITQHPPHNVLLQRQHQQQRGYIPFPSHHPSVADGQIDHVNASSATLLAMLQAQQQNGGYTMSSSSALNGGALAASASGSCLLMNQSFHSMVDPGSPWASQQQLDGEIVLEHVIGADSRHRLTSRQNSNNQQNQHAHCQHHPNNELAVPIRIAVPPPRTATALQCDASVKIDGCDAIPREPPAYVNVDLRNGACGEETALNVRELHRTDRNRLEFLSTGPGAFMLTSPSHGLVGKDPISVSLMAATSPPSMSAITALPPALMHQHQHRQLPPTMHHSFYGNGTAMSSSFHQQMSASISGALPPDDDVHQSTCEQGNNTLLTSGSAERQLGRWSTAGGGGSMSALQQQQQQRRQQQTQYGAAMLHECNSLGVLHQHGGPYRSRQLLDNVSSGGSHSTLIASSTNTMTTTTSSSANGVIAN